MPVGFNICVAGVTLISSVMKIDQGSGGPVRLLALVQEDGDDCKASNSAPGIYWSYLILAASAARLIF